MPKLINILAASVGGGLLLGAGLRFGEAIVGRRTSPRPSADAGDTLNARLASIEDRLGRLEKETPAAAHLSELESKLRAESELSRQIILDAVVESVQTRVIHRIAKLEEDVAGQSAALTELRECSLRNEQTTQQLLGGLDRLLARESPEQAIPARQRG